jgi:hypothetical protein
MGRNNQIILNLYNQSRVFGKNNQENNQENNQADYFYQTGPKSVLASEIYSIVRDVDIAIAIGTTITIITD